MASAFQNPFLPTPAGKAPAAPAAPKLTGVQPPAIGVKPVAAKPAQPTLQQVDQIRAKAGMLGSMPPAMPQAAPQRPVLEQGGYGMKGLANIGMPVQQIPDQSSIVPQNFQPVQSAPPGVVGRYAEEQAAAMKGLANAEEQAAAMKGLAKSGQPVQQLPDRVSLVPQDPRLIEKVVSDAQIKAAAQKREADMRAAQMLAEQAAAAKKPPAMSMRQLDELRLRQMQTNAMNRS